VGVSGTTANTTAVHIASSAVTSSFIFSSL
jgi:hypothetical protein